MEKKYIVLLIVVMFAGQSFAQDTLHLTEPSLNYLCMYRDLFYRQNEGDTLLGWTGGIGASQLADQEAFYMYTDTAVRVYGIAVSAFHTNYGEEVVLYPSLDSCYDYLRLYEADSNTLRQVGEDLKLCMADAPDYYMDLTLKSCWWDLGAPPMPAYPVFERYFDKPVVVEDSFYVGRKYHAGRRNPNGYPSQMTERISLYGRLQCTNINPCNYALFHDMTGDRYNPASYYWHYYPNDIEFGCIYIFPILTPRDTTQQGDTSHVGISGPLQRFVGVMPNPATNEVKVVSSFGMQGIDVYDATGRQTASIKVDGLQATLNVESWPRGHYVLHIHTPNGTAVKKLQVVK